MNIRLKSHSLLLIICLFILSFGILGIHNAKADIGPGIAVAPEYPKEQIKENGIFNVIFHQNKHYDLTLKVANTSNENKTITISPNTAYTSDDGNIVFDKTNLSNDVSKKYDFRSLFEQKEKKITVPAQSISKVQFGLKMPPKAFHGIILGGFYITIPNNSNSNVKSTFKVKNNYSYSLAAAIHNSAGVAQPKFQLGNIVSSNNNGQMQVNSNIKNVNAGIISGMNVSSEITKDSNNKVVSKSSRNNLSMAPNSSFDYKDTIENSLSPGKYKVQLNVTDDSGHTWNESKDFKVNTKEYVTHFTQKVPWMLYTLIGIIILLALIIVFLVYYQFKNKHKENNQSKNNTKN